MTREKQTILIIDDNQDILFNLELLLKFNGYDVLKALNGNEALYILKSREIPPDLIICDILMPVMDGYSFFKQVIQNIQWSHIPFIFLSAKTSQEDIRFGKKLGVDDYITKPFDKNYLLDVISGKLTRKKLARKFNKSIDRKLEILRELESSTEKIFKKEEIKVVHIVWDEIRGPILKNYFPHKASIRNWIEELGIQLFQSTVAIYGNEDYSRANCVLFNVSNINLDAVVYFDSIGDNSIKGDQKQYMFALLAPKVNYFEFLKIKTIFSELSLDIKKTGRYEKIEDNWNNITSILTEENSIFTT